MQFKTTDELKKRVVQLAASLRQIADSRASYEQAGALIDSFAAYVLRIDRDAESNAARLGAALRHSEQLQQGYRVQYELTTAACADNRDNWNEIYRLRAELKEVREERDQLESNNARGCRVVMEIWEDKKSLLVELEAARENTRIALAQGQEYQDRMNAVDREFHLLSVANLEAGKELREARELTQAQALRIDRLKSKLRKARKGASEASESQPATPLKPKKKTSPASLAGPNRPFPDAVTCYLIVIFMLFALLAAHTFTNS